MKIIQGLATEMDKVKRLMVRPPACCLLLAA